MTNTGGLPLRETSRGTTGEGRVDNVTEVNFFLFVEVELPATAAGEAEGDEVLGLEAIQGLWAGGGEGAGVSGLVQG